MEWNDIGPFLDPKEGDRRKVERNSTGEGELGRREEGVHCILGKSLKERRQETKKEGDTFTHRLFKKRKRENVSELNRHRRKVPVNGGKVLCNS